MNEKMRFMGAMVTLEVLHMERVEEIFLIKNELVEVEGSLGKRG